MSTGSAGFLPRAQLQQLINLLKAQGYEVSGPQVKDGAILYQALTAIDQLPVGVQDEQAPGHYRLTQTGSERFFAWANGPQALKPFLFTPGEVIWQARRLADGRIEFIRPESPGRKQAVLGVRACDLAALRLQDQHFLQGDYVDTYYADRRKGLFLVSVNCSQPADTCFCASTGDGPSATAGYDINLTELDAGFVPEAGSDAGQALVDLLLLQPLSEQHRAAIKNQHDQAVQAQSRALPKIPLHNLLQANRNHPQWQDIAERCLACGNCTQVCPTCFCHSESDLTALDGGTTEHRREWDSCFTAGHAYLAGFQVRPDIKSRYRQWMTHKLDTWHDQYGRSGCVGCGRCTTWCPAAIDFVEEACKITGENP
ncbi:MAG: 4Fe-4S dicluster domain-containing protein [Pontibacterium sp.]